MPSHPLAGWWRSSRWCRCRTGNAIGVVGEVQGVAAYGHLAELAAVVDIAIGNRAVGTADSHTVLVIGVGPGGAVLGNGCQLPAMLPGVLPHAIRQGVTHGIVGNGSAVIGGEQVIPFPIPIGVGVLFSVILASQEFWKLQNDVCSYPRGIPPREFLHIYIER